MFLAAMSLVQAFMMVDPALILFFANIAAATIVVSGVSILAERLMRRGPLPLRHLLLVCGLVAALATPLLIGMLDVAGVAPIQIAASQPEFREAVLPEVTTPVSRQPASTPRAELADSSSGLPVSETVDRAASPVGDEAGSVSVAAERALAPPIATPSPLVIGSAAVLIVWLGGCFYQLARLVRGFLSVRRLLRGAQPMDDPRIALIASEAARRLGMRRLPVILQAAEIDAPLSIGLLRSRVILPAGQVIEWSDSAWRALLLHELAHVQRGDLAIGLLQRLAIAMYWWNPLAYRLSNRIGTLREQICDDVVTRHGSRDDGYATIIIELATRVGGRLMPNTALGVADSSPGELAQRIHRLLEPERTVVTSLTRLQKLAIGSFCIALLLGISGTTVRWAEAAEPEEKSEVAGTVGDAAQQALTAVNDTKEVVPLEKRVRLVDSEGKPIAGATVSPWAIRSAMGHGPWSPQGMGESEPPVVTTNTEGRANISFPRYVTSAERLPAIALTCVVKHPDFATTRYNDVDVTPDALAAEAEIKLNPGAQLTIIPQAAGVEFDRERLFATWSSPTDSYSVRVNGQAQIELPHLPAGDELIRVVYLPKDGPAMFSEVLHAELVDGQKSMPEMQLRSGIYVTGKLAEVVPRPVVNGVVMGDVIERSKSGHALTWRVWSKIERDGTFRLGRLPGSSQLQVIAQCDGFMATSGEAPDFVDANQRDISASFSTPQVFKVSPEQSDITLAMTPTAECRIRVVDPAGRPIAGARCQFWPNVKWWNSGSQVYCHPRFTLEEILLGTELSEISKRSMMSSPFEATSDASGIATVRNLPRRSNSLIVTSDKFELPIDGNRRWVDVDMTAAVAQEITITLEPKSSQRLGDLPRAVLETCATPATHAAQTVKPAAPKSFKVESRPTELAGVVVDEAGKPLAGVKVDAWTWHPGNETKTNAEGRFVLKGFERNEAVEIEFTKADYSPSLFIGQQAGAPDWIVVLTQGTALEGRVLDPVGEPVPGAKVRAWRGPFENPGVQISQVWTETTADSEGRYRLNVEPGSYTIEMRFDNLGALRVPNVAVAAKEIKQLDLKLERGTKLAAVVRDSVTGEPVPGIELWNFMQPGIDGTSNDQGLLEIPHMMAGEFEFRVVAKGKRRTELAGKYARWWSPQATKEWEREEKNLDNPLKLPAGTPEDVRKQLQRDARVDSKFQRNLDGLSFNLQGNKTAVEIFVEPAVTIKGRVLSPDGEPVAGATVAPAKTGSGNSLTGDTRYSVTTDRDGNFTMLAPAGKNFEYNLIAHDGKYQQWRKWANGATEPFKSQPGEVIEGLEIKLTRGGTVKGIVLDEQGQPKPNLEVRAAAIDMRDNRYYLPITQTDQDGRYELKFVAPGRQHIQVAPFWLRADEAPGPATKVVDVTSDGDLNGIDFKLTAAAEN